MRCEKCGSYAINLHLHGRDNSNPDLCDVCHYRKRSEDLEKRIVELETFIRRYRYNIGGEHQLLIDKILGEAEE